MIHREWPLSFREWQASKTMKSAGGKTVPRADFLWNNGLRPGAIVELIHTER